MAHGDLISVKTLARHLVEPSWVVLDCRFSLADSSAGLQAYTAGHIPGAQYAHLDHELSGPVGEMTGRHPLPDVDTLVMRLEQWGIDNGTQVVAYDDAGGAIAARLWWLLRWLGHNRVALLDGGWQAWCAAGYAQELDSRIRPQGHFVPRPNDELWLSSEAVAQGVAEGGLLLVDARTPERYRGEQEPIDPVAGHIPGALHFPLQQNISEDGRFLAPAELASRYRALLGSVPAEQVVHYCGSGVTACHNLLAMELAGLAGSRLYVGSWSEWIRDAKRPLAGVGAVC